MFYRYRLAIRGQFSALHQSRALFDQYVCDAYVKAESSRLAYIRQHQADLRVDNYVGLLDAMRHRGVETNAPLGKMVILPSSFYGGERQMRKSYHDALAIMRHFGRPDLFITFTCNPKWPEIEENVGEGGINIHRADLVARVFKQKLDAFIADIRVNHVFGKPTVVIYTVEFQKRGLLHAHIVVTLEAASKMTTPEKVDAAVRAEIPDPEVEPLLHNIVINTMIHNPCGRLNPKAGCMGDDGKCTKHFPKNFEATTVFGNDSFPRYKRRDHGITTLYGGKTPLDNRFVVPYNPVLTLKYGGHINVEVCYTIEVMKYLFKYIYKGGDCATIQVSTAADGQQAVNCDEVSQYLDMRYVSTAESCWRLFGYPLQYRNIAVFMLNLHLPFNQPVFFQAGEEEDALRRAKERDTKLTAWFKLNASSEPARLHLYVDIPSFYCWNDKRRVWTLRKKLGQTVLGRLPKVSPANSEQFRLRMLLHHIPGATSFECLRTVDGLVCDSFKDACLKLHLLEDDNEYHRCMEDARQTDMPRAMRVLFVTIMTQCSPAEPAALWEEFADSMSEDLRLQYGVDRARNMALLQISEMLVERGSSCAAVGLPVPVLDEEAAHVYGDYVAADEARQAEEMFATVNAEQLGAYQAIMEGVQAVAANQLLQPKVFLIDGPGGTGKTYLYNLILHKVRSLSLVAVSCAWTGIAATLLAGGTTCHSLFKLPIPVQKDSTCNLQASDANGELLISAAIILIDETPMATYHALDAMDLLLRDLTGLQTPFAGKVVVMGGDFRQVLPVVKGGGRAKQVTMGMKNSCLWPLVRTIKLTQNLRAGAEQVAFAQWLLEIGEGRTPEPAGHLLIPASIMSTGDMIAEVFSDLTGGGEGDCAILCPKNSDCDAMNRRVLERLPGASRTFFSTDRAEDETGLEVTIDYLNSISTAGLPPHHLTLKVEAIVMLLRNISAAEGLCNGTRLRIKRLTDFFLDCEILGGIHNGKRVFIARVTLTPSDTNLPFVMTRRQFPVKLSYAMTINKSQGQTFSKVGIYLPQPVFSHGQLYVAMCRVRRLEDLTFWLGQANVTGVKLPADRFAYI
jgi:PIF1-like helicase/Helitron helicase-like domain at N-terminus